MMRKKLALALALSLTLTSVPANSLVGFAEDEIIMEDAGWEGNGDGGEAAEMLTVGDFDEVMPTDTETETEEAALETEAASETEVSSETEEGLEAAGDTADVSGETEGVLTEGEEPVISGELPEAESEAETETDISTQSDGVTLDGFVEGVEIVGEGLLDTALYDVEKSDEYSSAAKIWENDYGKADITFAEGSSVAYGRFKAKTDDLLTIAFSDTVTSIALYKDDQTEGEFTRVWNELNCGSECIYWVEQDADYLLEIYGTGPASVTAAESVPLTTEDETKIENKLSQCFSFTPDKSGIYRIWSSDNSGDPQVSLYQKTDNGLAELASNDDGDDLNFSLSWELSKGKTYYYIVNYVNYNISVSPGCTVHLGVEDQWADTISADVYSGYAEVWKGGYSDNISVAGGEEPACYRFKASDSDLLTITAASGTANISLFRVDKESEGTDYACSKISMLSPDNSASCVYPVIKGGEYLLRIKASAAATIKAAASGELTFPMNVPAEGIRSICYHYTPSESGTYVIASSGCTQDLKAFLYEEAADTGEIALKSEDYAGGNNGNFSLACELQAGKKYYYIAVPYYGTGTFNANIHFNEPKPAAPAGVTLHLPIATTSTVTAGTIVSMDESDIYAEYSMEGESQSRQLYFNKTDMYGNHLYGIYFVNANGEEYYIDEFLPLGTYSVKFKWNDNLLDSGYTVNAVLLDSSSLPFVSLGQPFTSSVTEQYFRFTAPYDGYYRVSGDTDTGYFGGGVFEETSTGLSWTYNLKKGQTYIVRIVLWNGATSGTFTMKFEHSLAVVSSVPATCTAAGSITYQCTGEDCIYEGEGCTYTCTEEIPAFGHNIVAVSSVPATCTTAGSVTYTCTNAGCTYTYTETVSSRGGHTYSAWTVTTPPTALAAGVQTRRCTVCGNAETATVAKLTPTIKVSATSVPLKVKQSTTKLKVTGLAAGDYVKSWKSSNTKIVKVNSKGKITAQNKTGKANITITLASGLTKTVKVTVKKTAVKTTKISGLSKKLTLAKGKKTTLSPVLTPITTTDKVTYSTSNKKVATVTSKGVVTAKSAGTAKITVKSGSKKFVVTVKVPKTAPTKITGVPAKKTLAKGKSLTLKPKLSPKGAEAKITYKSSNKKVATVSSSGKVVAKKKGTAVITVTAGKVKTTCKITVK